MKAYEVVRQHIEERILAGELSVGSLLPSERDMAADFKVSRAAVREALRMMGAQGLITSRVGAGPNSGTRIAGQNGPALGRLLQLHVALSEFPIDDVVEVRVMLERLSATAASANATSNNLAKLGDILAEMESDHMELEQFNDLDTRFHVAIAELGENQFVTVLTTAVRQALASPIREASDELPDYQRFRRDLNRQHRRVFEAIANGDAARAADLIEEHIRTAYAILPMGGKKD
ncbi:FCD domain-containing protein [Brooklawnia sp.]|uniref:FadR/GntR family transcriptional regulator n=1 Tax=Brooklawnia sp. TaxID=2699740 RepID=UPI00311E7D40